MLLPKSLSFIITRLAAAALAAGHATAPMPADIPCDLAVRNAQVLAMDTAEVQRDRTVRIGGGRILSIIAASRDRGAGCARIVDAGGRYLVPGLNDAHVHVETNAFAEALGQPPAKIDYEAALALYLAHGVTGVRVLSGAADILAFRNRASGALAPRLVVSSPMLSGEPPILPEPITRVVTDAASARAAVAEFLDAGYDFIKIRSNLSEEAYTAVLDEARARGAYVDGHVTRAVGAEAVLRSNQGAIAHLDELAAVIQTPEDLERIAALVGSCGCFISTALSVTKSIVDQLTGYDHLLTREEMGYLHPLIVQSMWLKPNNPYFGQGAPVDFFRDLNDRSKTLLRALSNTGAAVVAGSDAMSPMILPGASLHDELQIMTEAGLTPHQALKTATTAIAEHVPGFADLGRLRQGFAASALLVPDNPLDNLAVLRRPDAVLLEGRWLDRAALDALLARAAAQGASE